ncbi:MAG TPA: DUF5695 domain-containing protein [Bryobacteraceae bacterium]|nr:DUF5695 domain-containing protein [Bryobacteraceae bacterium]
MRLFLLAAVAGAAALANSSFEIQSSPSGLTSLKRVHDRYDTDYIAGGHALGNVLVRYKAPADAAWQTALYATGGGLSFHVGKAIPTIATSSKASASPGGTLLDALNDQIEPASSSNETVPRFVWINRSGTREWVEYDFPKPESVSSAQVYWSTHEEGDRPCRLPQSWRLLYREGDDWKEVHDVSAYGVARDQYNTATFDPVTTSALRLEAQLQTGATAGILEWRVNTNVGRQVELQKDLEIGEAFALRDEEVEWSISLANKTAQPIEVGDLAVPLPFNTEYVWDKTETYTKRLIRHSFIAGNGSWVFWTRTNAEGPFLTLTPQQGTHFEYFDESGPAGRVYTAYIHSAASGAELRAKGGTWRQENTRLLLAPGQSASYRFRLRWAKDYDAVRDTLYDEGLFDVHVVPGMTIPTDLAVLLSLRTRRRIASIAPEHLEQTTVEYLGTKGKDVHVYRVRFSRLGENLLTVRYEDHQQMPLEFFVTEPLETLIKKHAAFLASHHQHRDPSKWYNGLFSDWDMKNHVLRSPDNRDGLPPYLVNCDDPGLGKAPYLASKNVFFPSEVEIEALEYYLKNFVWGKLQMTGQEPYPYAIYGIDNWKVNRESKFADQRGNEHLWRIYDYPHIILLYFRMYQIAERYPNMVHYLDKSAYLERAFGTAKAFFTVPLKIANWSAYETGTYNELVIPDLIDALAKSGKTEEAAWLRAAWEKKAKYFINDHPYLFGSEYPFDSTGFESTHALARYAMTHALDVKHQDAQQFLDEQIRLNIACRGWLETAYYHLGSDFRGGGSGEYTLSYMAQMGGWAILDYGLYFAADPIRYLRLGYNSFLSSWALESSGTPESNYGYWFPGKENDGGAGGGFEPRPWGRSWIGKLQGRGSWWYNSEIDLGFSGALRTAATIVSDDPIFGLIAYGGDLERAGRLVRVIPKDGLRVRFHVIRGTEHLHMELDRDGFAAGRPIEFDDAFDAVSFTLENRSADEHTTMLQVAGLAPGKWTLDSGGRAVAGFEIAVGETREIPLPLPPGGAAFNLSRGRTNK